MRSYDTVLAEIPALLTLLDDQNPRVRTWTAYLLAWFPELADTSAPLRERLLQRQAASDAAHPRTAGIARVAGPGNRDERPQPADGEGRTDRRIGPLRHPGIGPCGRNVQYVRSEP